MMNYKQKLFSFIFLGLLAIGVYFYWVKQVSDPSADTDSSVATKEVGGVSVEGQGDYTVELVEPGDTQNELRTRALSFPMPNLARPIKIMNNQNEVVAKRATEEIKRLSLELKENPAQLQSWLYLGIYRKLIGDYNAVVEILDYAAKVWPDQYEVFNNLADIYQFYIRDYSLAEKNWLRVIEIKPNFPPAYQNLYALYLEPTYKKDDLALPILLRGLRNSPQSTDIMLALARHYRKIGDTKTALSYYTKAADTAKLQQNITIEKAIRAEASELSL